MTNRLEPQQGQRRRLLAASVATLLVASSGVVAVKWGHDQPRAEQRLDADGSQGARPGVESLQSASDAVPAPGSLPTVAAAETRSGVGAGQASTPSGNPGVVPSAEPARDVPTGKGISKDGIDVGIGWLDLNAVFAMASAYMGTPTTNQGATTRDYAETVVAYLNDRGGVAGRPINAVFHEYPAAQLFSSEGRRRAEQEMCADFTEDHTVFAMIPYVDTEGITLQCAVDTDTPYIGVSSAGETVDEQRLAEAGRWWLRPNWLGADRRERTLVARLVAQGFFGPEAKIGIMVADRPANRRAVERSLQPALQNAGVRVVALAAYPDRIESPWDNYVLQFRQAGVTHVVWAQDSSASTAPTLFMRAAENQRWRAKQAMASDWPPKNVLGTVPPAQLHGAQGIGWSPYDDGRLVRGDGPISKPDALCREILRDAGYQQGQDQAWLGAGLQYCEGLFFLGFALDRAAAHTTAGLVSAVEAIGDAYVPVTTFAAHFGVGRHDGVAMVRDLAYDVACDCFEYGEGLHPTAR